MEGLGKGSGDCPRPVSAAPEVDGQVSTGPPYLREKPDLAPGSLPGDGKPALGLDPCEVARTLS